MEDRIYTEDELRRLTDRTYMEEIPEVVEIEPTEVTTLHYSRWQRRALKCDEFGRPLKRKS